MLGSLLHQVATKPRRHLPCEAAGRFVTLTSKLLPPQTMEDHKIFHSVKRSTFKIVLKMLYTAKDQNTSRQASFCQLEEKSRDGALKDDFSPSTGHTPVLAACA